ncbi:3-isopropylmalate dehydrogenase [Rhodoplanes serenus]|uniref:3-isopropylmalate dehydrogenase n=1 Tax=Rhodoplanes serenus TaxID=200615 RepID=A0A3S4BUM8_9BRAD|nr:isocitrate/isopropylmalate family dehydrogenase [Rhodoplanes serenus]VCU07737.1 3-isopropylmalate dehydrogenase [Rhodoplanes serenus]
MSPLQFDIAVLPGDGIGAEITAPAVELVKEAGRQAGLDLRFETLEAGAGLYARTGTAFPEENFQRAAAADAIYLCAMGLPDVRYPDGTEVGPQHDLRKRLNLYAGVRPCRTMPGVPSPLADPRAATIDFVIVRESTEGLFAFPRGHDLDDEEYAHNLLRVSRTVCDKLFDFAFRLARRRHRQGAGKNLVTHVDKANVLSSQHRARQWFDAVAARHPDVRAAHQYVDFCAFEMVRRPWMLDVMPTENQYGDILSDLASALMGGMGMAPSADIGDRHAVFQPCHGTAPDIAGQGKANPTAMILSGAMMLDYLGDKANQPAACAAAATLTRAVEAAYADGTLRPMELGGSSGTRDIVDAVGRRLAG